MTFASLSQCSGVLSLSFKKGDRLVIRNWPPIFLSNVDCKLPSRATAGQLLKVIHLVVDKDQTCPDLWSTHRKNVFLSNQPSQNRPAASKTSRLLQTFDRLHPDGKYIYFSGRYIFFKATGRKKKQ